ncbi:polyketide cyclase [Devosia sp. Root436]|uniref:SRPBCC family protein n=1 Tax=Devosia sp. Root436 TaxID=1736537 RepID=UPI0006F5154D|nr:SRPBCC family protein [Devosia sp. Root436]KQX38666.1 polyketide cyclase [Devosia sp. Root436]
MAFDLAAHLGAMTREVHNLEKDGQPAKAVFASRVYDTTPPDLWDALTRPERIKRWFAPVSGDLKLGGRYSVEGNASGTVLECEPEKKVALTWEFAGAISWVNLTLTPEGAGTRLELEHIAHISPHWDRFGPGAVGIGWDLSFMGLARYLADLSFEMPPEAAAQWYATDEYKSLVRTTGDGWGQADIAAGADRRHALEAAEATRKFYTGEAPPEN